MVYITAWKNIKLVMLCERQNTNNYILSDSIYVTFWKGKTIEREHNGCKGREWEQRLTAMKSYNI